MTDPVQGSAALSFQRCPVWVPQNPDVPHNDRLHCILPSNHQGAHVGDERFTGLHHKYDVTRLHDVTGKHADCRYFVLDPQHDPLAREALRRYASVARERGFDQLSMDLMGWVDRCEPKPPTSDPRRGATHCGRRSGMTDKPTPCSAAIGAALIAAERKRQIEREGWSIEHDREHGAMRLMRAGHAYSANDPRWWPFDNGASFKPKGPLRNLVRAGALYQAAADVATDDDNWSFASRSKCEASRDDCAKRIDALIAEVREVLDGT